MAEFFDIVTNYPVLIWSVALLVMTLNWGLVLLGVFDIDLLDGEFEFDLDLDADIDVDADMDAAGDADAAAPGGMPAWLSVLMFVGLGRIPATIVFTVFAFSGWLLAIAMMLNVAPFLGWLPGFTSLAFVASVLSGYLVTGVIARPLAKVFETSARSSGESLCGQVAVITTGGVSASFGQARVDDGGAGLLLSVRCASANRLRRGHRVLLIDHDTTNNVYTVEPYESFEADEIRSFVNEAPEAMSLSVRMQQGGNDA